MKTVEAIKDTNQILLMKSFLKSRSSRDYCLFLLGINTGIRIHDLLHLYVHQFIAEDGSLYDHLMSPVHLEPPVYLNHQVQQALTSYIEEEGLSLNDYLFKSKRTNEPISRQQAYRVINEASRQAGICEPIGTHTLRKTFGYHAYRKGIAISLIQKRLQQSTPSETRQYIGVANTTLQIKLDVNL
ncbi:tyrosine-type recombinase/integrase [Metabacillus malikii]|uniref:Integrase n=1 Tax=Metabacillus malikii TaxID=1504265 RepID=A0ABT9ZDA3_9BACI|nr:tyrosine-type recombinase/integrase [Metabacillus malikii]MDQ0230245.1 integrase [Metabacillus malikii]